MAYASFENVVERIAQLSEPGLIAIDGLPLSGKSTLARRLVERLGVGQLSIDDFVLPERLWPQDRSPRFPFGYMRYGEFMLTIAALATEGKATYHPFEWPRLDVSPEPRTIRLDRPVVVEGVSALHPELCRHYALKIWVDSDYATTFAASVARGVGGWFTEWRDWFLPSVELYLATDPMSRVDLVTAGRGVPPGSIALE
jgi:uridine kinase